MRNCIKKIKSFFNGEVLNDVNSLGNASAATEVTELLAKLRNLTDACSANSPAAIEVMPFDDRST